MADAGSCGALRGGGRLELLGTLACLTRGGPKRRESQVAGLRVASSAGGSSSGHWCWWPLFQRGAARAPRRTKAQYARPGPAAPERGLWGAPSLRRLQQVLAAWRRRPEPLEEIPLLVLERAQGAA